MPVTITQRDNLPAALQKGTYYITDSENLAAAGAEPLRDKEILWCEGSSEYSLLFDRGVQRWNLRRRAVDLLKSPVLYQYELNELQPLLGLHAGLSLDIDISSLLRKKEIEAACALPEGANGKKKHQPLINHGSLRTAGRFMAFFTALACGIGTGTSVLLLAAALGPWAPILGAMACLITTYVNWRILRNAVPDVLIALFGGERFLQSLLESRGKDGVTKPLSTAKKAAMGVAGLMTFVTGAITSVLLAKCVLVVVAMMAPASPVIGLCLAVFFGAVSLVATSALMFRSCAQMLQKENFLQGIKDYLGEIFSLNTSLPQNRGLSMPALVVRNMVVGLTMLTVVGLALWGLYQSYDACKDGCLFLLREIPGAVTTAVVVAVNVLSLGVATLAQIPFTLQTAVTTVARWFRRELPPTVHFVEKIADVDLSKLENAVIFANSGGNVEVRFAKRGQFVEPINRTNLVVESLDVTVHHSGAPEPVTDRYDFRGLLSSVTAGALFTKLLPTGEVKYDKDNTLALSNMTQRALNLAGLKNSSAGIVAATSNGWDDRIIAAVKWVGYVWNTYIAPFGNAAGNTALAVPGPALTNPSLLNPSTSYGLKETIGLGGAFSNSFTAASNIDSGPAAPKVYWSAEGVGGPEFNNALKGMLEPTIILTNDGDRKTAYFAQNGELLKTAEVILTRDGEKRKVYTRLVNDVNLGKGTLSALDGTLSRELTIRELSQGTSTAQALSRIIKAAEEGKGGALVWEQPEEWEVSFRSFWQNPRGFFGRTSEVADLNKAPAPAA